MCIGIGLSMMCIGIGLSMMCIGIGLSMMCIGIGMSMVCIGIGLSTLYIVQYVSGVHAICSVGFIWFAHCNLAICIGILLVSHW